MRIYVKQTDSTNRMVKERVDLGLPSGTVIWAGKQNGGKGQHGRSFASPQGGLYFSLVLKPDLPVADLPLITLVTGLACRDVLSDHCHVEALIKWPNDLYLCEKKIGGILCENLLDTTTLPPVATVIIGVGININSRLHDFPVELHSTITTLFEQVHSVYDIALLLDRCVARIQDMVTRMPTEKAAFLDRWRYHDYLNNRPLQYINGTERILGRGEGLTDDGRYRFVDGSGQVHSILAGQLRPVDSVL